MAALVQIHRRLTADARCAYAWGMRYLGTGNPGAVHRVCTLNERATYCLFKLDKLIGYQADRPALRVRADPRLVRAPAPGPHRLWSAAVGLHGDATLPADDPAHRRPDSP